MNAAELVAAIRDEHREFVGPWVGAHAEGFCERCEDEWPCPPAIAADRIEAAYRSVWAGPGVRETLDGGDQ